MVCECSQKIDLFIQGLTINLRCFCKKIQVCLLETRVGCFEGIWASSYFDITIKWIYWTYEVKFTFILLLWMFELQFKTIFMPQMYVFIILFQFQTSVVILCRDFLSNMLISTKSRGFPSKLLRVHLLRRARYLELINMIIQTSNLGWKFLKSTFKELKY